MPEIVVVSSADGHMRLALVSFDVMEICAE